MPAIMLKHIRTDAGRDWTGGALQSCVLAANKATMTLPCVCVRVRARIALRINE